MADDVPVYDVLCEAMEYLCKLGVNLRVRSENLRAKKIRRDKLKNAHAVQKAASKVLLICELSKKSLLNVESGVKQVLKHVEAAQSASAATSTTESSPNSKHGKEYHYFVYQSHKLKIAKKIPLNHFLSVQVQARNMPTSLQDKYPVYHNCKLYRLRKSLEKKKEGLHKNSTSIECQNNLSEKPEKYKENEIKDGNDSDCIVSSDVQITESLEKEIQATDVKENNEIPDTDDSKKNDKNQLSNESDDNSLPNSERTSRKKKIQRRISEFCQKDKRKKTQVIDTSEEDIPQQETIDRKNNTTLDSIVSDNENSDKPVMHKSKKPKLNESQSELEDKENHNRNPAQSEYQSDQSDQPIATESESAKPMIKCVSISKLLKPDVLEKIEDKPSTHNSDKAKKSLKLYYKKDNRDGHKKFQEKTETAIRCKSVDSEEEYWNTKRKEVKAFKPKNFVIQVNKLPKLSKSFLLKHKLKRIIQNDSVVCEIVDKTADLTNKNKLTQDYTNTLDQSKNKQIPCDIDKVKNALLNDSDSDLKSPQNLERSEEQEKIKNALLNESDSDNNSSVSAASIPACIVKKHTKEKTNMNKNSEDNAQESNNSDIEKNSNDEHDKSDSSNNKQLSVGKKKKKNVIKVKLPLREKKKKNHKSKKNENETTLAGTMDENEKNLDEVNKNEDELHKNDKITVENDVANKTEETPVKTDESNRNEIIPGKTNVNENNLRTLSANENENTDTNEKIADKSEEKEKEIELVGNSGENEKEVDPDKHKDNNLSDNNEKCQEKPVKNMSEHEETEKNVDEDNSLNNIKHQSSPKNSDEIKRALLNSSDDNQSKTPDKQKNKDSITPRSKRKHIMESMHAKKMLLTYSSSSETEDEQLRGVLKEIKDSLLKGASSSDEDQRVNKGSKGSHRRKLMVSSDSDASAQKEKKEPSPSHTDISSKEKSDIESTKSGTADAMDTQSNSSRSKMGRSKANSTGRSSCRSSDSQDTRDKDIDGLTNLKTLIKTRRRRGTPSTVSKSSRSTRRHTRRMSKPPLISAENMLRSESSSDAASGAESEGGEDLPNVTLPNINGNTITHLAKDDLLGETDSSSSKENDSEDSKKEDSDDNVKSKRRKAVVAISSDSEAGSSRKKDKAVRLSDFEDSETESSEPANKAKRKKKAIDSDSSTGSNEDGKKKRRRIKPVNDSDGSGSDTENEGKKHGRKNIRKVMGKNQLEEATKKAAREEKERIARIAERQKLYNNLEFDESGKPDEVVLEKVILDFDPETKEPLIEVDRGLVKKLKPHQANGIKFMWNACFESVKRIKKDRGSGCILAHCMGLGKTLQVVSLTHTLLTHSSLTGVNRVLVVCPLSTVLNWVNEFRMWLKHAETEFEVDVYELSRYKQNSERAFQLQQWFNHGGVCVLGYEMFRNLSADNAKKFKKKMLRNFQESLVDPGPDLVVCDEGHLLKNEKTSLSQSMNRVKTHRRIVLTGTPLQNNLKEYYCMVQFVKPNLLGKYNEYLNRFVNPITNGQYTDSTEHDIRVMKRRSHVLHKMLDGAVQRRDYGVLAPFLPPKHEYVLFITLTDVQIKLYQYYLDNYSRRPLAGKSSGFLFPDFQSLQRIWTHPLVLKYNSERYEIMQQKKREREEEDSEGSLVDFIDDDSTPEETSTEESSDDSSDMSDDSRKKSKKKKSSKKGKGKEGKSSTRRGTRANPVELEEAKAVDPDILEVKNENPTEWWIKLVEEDELEDMRNSHKLVLLFDILRQCDTIGDKLLVFSQSLYSLDLIEHFLGKVDEATQDGRIDPKLGGHVGSWSPGVDYFRLDGSTSCENRSIWCKNFNREDNPRARLFLISTRAGGLGINLVAANRVVIFDVSWNPSHDVQSIFRVYRFGQKKPCYVYRFLAMGTMEEKIYERQVTKQAISKRVIDEQQIDRHYAENDLAELYKFEATPPQPRPLPPLPKDRLFAEMLREHEAQIYKYHEHDSLLENKEEETLSEEERKAAWEDFENEKNRPPPAPFPSAWPMANGMVPNILQQQQLAYAALAQMLRRDMPNVTDNQIRDMLPLIYNANPGIFGGYDFGLMQKMSEIYKYAQPGMMNPAMMNPVMNPTGGGAMSGSSGLQYEPPWQRQQQQQQQMRLQQLMQQQQNMGAKFYAGGLGSRDPVAMALQQQRAREIMVGDRGRARGRPPMAPRAPPAAHALGPPPAAHGAPVADLPAAAHDVVNLDSD